jgi:hypothetical protein
LPFFSLGLSLPTLYTRVIRISSSRSLELHLAHRRSDRLFCCLRDDEMAEVRVRVRVVHQTVLQSVLYINLRLLCVIKMPLRKRTRVQKQTSQKKNCTAREDGVTEERKRGALSRNRVSERVGPTCVRQNSEHQLMARTDTGRTVDSPRMQFSPK